MTLGKVFEESEARLHRYAMNLARDGDRADDLVSETFARAVTNEAVLQKLNSHQVRAWLFRTLKNLFIDEQRARQRHFDLVEQMTREAEIAPYTVNELESPEILEMVSRSDHELLMKRYVERMTSREIADQIGIPAATVRSRLRAALQRLRAQYAQYLQL